MDTLNIPSAMTHFRVIERISEVSRRMICGEVYFEHAPVYSGLEAMAQLAALHVRHRVRFERHAFLLKVQHCRLPTVDYLAGPLKVIAELNGQSSNGFVYNTKALGAGNAEFQGRLLIGTRDYDKDFSKDNLGVHYRKRWTELRE